MRLRLRLRAVRVDLPEDRKIARLLAPSFRILSAQRDENRVSDGDRYTRFPGLFAIKNKKKILNTGIPVKKNIMIPCMPVLAV